MSPSTNPDDSISPNDTSQKPKPKMKLKLNLSPAKISVILTCLAFVAIGATVALILAGRPKTTLEVEIPNNDQTGNQSENQNQDQTKPPAANIPDESHLTVQLTDFHRPNNLIFSGNEYNYETRSYTKAVVSNLKNKDLENRINSIMSDYYAANNSHNVHVMASFGDILSFYEPTPQDYFAKTYNLRLDTGDEIRFEDIFTAGTNITELVVEAYRYSYLYEIYDSCHKNPSSTCGYVNVGDVDPGPDFEERLVKVANVYKDSGISQFYITESRVYFKIDGLATFIELAPIHEHVAIYKRFLTNGDNIYEKNFNPAEGFVFSNMFAINPLYPNYKFGLLRPNLFVYTSLTDCSIGTGEACDTLRTEVDQLIQRVEDYAAARPDSYFIFALPDKTYFPKNYYFLSTAATNQDQLLDMTAKAARRQPGGAFSILGTDIGIENPKLIFLD